MADKEKRSRVELCIKLLQILNTGRIYNISTLAGLLDVKERYVIELRLALDQACKDTDTYIETIPGRYGGYRLHGNAVLPALKLTHEEKDALSDSFDYLMSKKDFLKKREYLDAYSKIISNITLDEKEDKKIIVAENYQLSMSEEEIKQRYNFIEFAINNHQSIQIDYLSLKNGQKVHELDPYKLYIFNNSWFFLAWNPEVGDVWSFKLNRIKSYRLLDKKFKVWKGFNPKDYIEDNGFKNNGEYHHVVFIAEGTKGMLSKERIYGKNQVTTDLEDGRVKVEVDMQNDDMIVSFILGGKEEITVLEPEWLIERVKETAQKILDKYK
jgi:predicted DNA-binding transcriptional regulator YafY